MNQKLFGALLSSCDGAQQVLTAEIRQWLTASRKFCLQASSAICSSLTLRFSAACECLGTIWIWPVFVPHCLFAPWAFLVSLCFVNMFYSLWQSNLGSRSACQKSSFTASRFILSGAKRFKRKVKNANKPGYEVSISKNSKAVQQSSARWLYRSLMSVCLSIRSSVCPSVRLSLCPYGFQPFHQSLSFLS